MVRVSLWSFVVAIVGLIGAAGLVGCGRTAEPATDRSIVGTWELDTRAMTEEALRQVELRLRENARPARPAAPAPAGDGAAAPAQPAANEAGPSPTEINAAKDKERARLAGTFATITVRNDGSYLAEYRTKIDNKETRRVLMGEWTLAAGVLVLKETEVMLDSEGSTAISSHRYQAERSRLLSITLRGTAPLGEVQEILIRR